MPSSKVFQVKFTNEGLAEVLQASQKVRKSYTDWIAEAEQAFRTAKFVARVNADNATAVALAEKDKVRAANSATRAIAAAYKELGVASSASLEEQKRRAINAFEAIRQSGETNLQVLANAQSRLAEKLKDINSKLNGTKAALDPVGSAYKLLGVTSEESFKQQKIAALQAFEAIKNSGIKNTQVLANAQIALTEKLKSLYKEVYRSNPEKDKAAAAQASVAQIAAAYKELGVVSTNSIEESKVRIIQAFKAIRDAAGVGSRDTAQAYMAMAAQLRALDEQLTGSAGRQKAAEMAKSAAAKEAGDKISSAYKELGIVSSASFDEQRKKAINAYNTIRQSGETNLQVLAAAEQSLKAKLGGINNSLYGDQAAKARAATQRISEAYRELSITSSASLDEQRRKAIQAFETIKTSGVASARDIANAQTALNAKLRELNTGLAANQKQVNRSAEGFTTLKGVVSGFVANLASSVVYQFTGALKGLADGIIQTGFQFERQRASLIAFLGNADAANKTFKELDKFASTTIFTLAESTDAAQRLIAAQVPPDKIIETLKRLGAIAAGANKPLEQILFVYTQIANQGVALSQDINQFYNAGLSAKDFADVLGVSTSQVKKMAAESQISFAVVEEVIRRATTEGGRFGKINEELGKTSAIRASNLVDAFERVYRVIFDAINPAISAFLDLVTGILKPLSENQEILSEISKIANQIAYSFKANPELAKEIGKTLSDFVLMVIKAIAKELERWKRIYRENKDLIDDSLKLLGFTLGIIVKIGTFTREVVLFVFEKWLNVCSRVYDFVKKTWDLLSAPLRPDSWFYQGMGNQQPNQGPASYAQGSRNLSEAPVTSPYGMRMHPILGRQRMHQGMDYGVDADSPLSLKERATVSGVGVNPGGYGNWIELQLANGTKLFFAHLNKVIAKADQQLEANQIFGLSGNTGRSTAPHLHLEANTNGAQVDPSGFARLINFGGSSAINQPGRLNLPSNLTQPTTFRDGTPVPAYRLPATPVPKPAALPTDLNSYVPGGIRPPASAKPPKVDAEGKAMLRAIEEVAKILKLTVEDVATIIQIESSFKNQRNGGTGGQYQGYFQIGPAAMKDLRRAGVIPGKSNNAADYTFTQQAELFTRYTLLRAQQLEQKGKPHYTPGDGVRSFYQQHNQGNMKPGVDGFGTPGGKTAKLRADSPERIAARQAIARLGDKQQSGFDSIAAEQKAREQDALEAKRVADKAKREQEKADAKAKREQEKAAKEKERLEEEQKKLQDQLKEAQERISDVNRTIGLDEAGKDTIGEATLEIQKKYESALDSLDKTEKSLRAIIERKRELNMATTDEEAGLAQVAQQRAKINELMGKEITLAGQAIDQKKTLEQLQRQQKEAELFGNVTQLDSQIANAKAANLVRQGTITEGEAQRVAIQRRMAEEQANLAKQIADLKVERAGTTIPEQIAYIDALIDRYTALSQISMEGLRLEMEDLNRQQAQINSAFPSGQEFAGALTDSIREIPGILQEVLQGTKSLGDAILGLLANLAKKLGDLFLNKAFGIAEGFFNKLFGGGAGGQGGGGIGGFFGRLFGGGGGGGGISSLFGGLGSGGAIFNPAVTLSGFTGGFAGGGLIRAPGNGSQDTAIAAVANREYVLSAPAVRAIGVPALNYLNTLSPSAVMAGSRTTNNSRTFAPVVNVNIGNVTGDALGRTERQMASSAMAELQKFGG